MPSSQVIDASGGGVKRDTTPFVSEAKRPKAEEVVMEEDPGGDPWEGFVHLREDLPGGHEIDSFSLV